MLFLVIFRTRFTLKQKRHISGVFSNKYKKKRSVIVMMISTIYIIRIIMIMMPVGYFIVIVSSTRIKCSL